MTKTYEFKTVIIVAVEANSLAEAITSAEEVVAEIEADLPVGASFVHKNGHAEVNRID